MALKTYRYKGGLFQFTEGAEPEGAEPLKPEKPAEKPKRTTKPKTPAAKEKVVEDETK